MATAKQKVYPYLVISRKGKLLNTGCAIGCALTEEFNKGVDCFFVNLPPQEIEFEIPAEEEIRPACAKLLDEQMVQERAAFYAQETMLKAIRNDLLQLAAPDILDAAS